MKLNNLRPAAGSTKNKYRKGRGEGSGNGLTAGRGHKGAKSRSGYSRKIGFEGGQMPLQRRVPKFGFTNINRVSYRGINLDSIQLLIDENNLSDTINKDTFVAFGLASKRDLIKILGRGELRSAVKIEANKFTASAKEAIEKAGGSAVEVK
ncbi:50S ribosomal protein L15 [Ornithobacterium rhinotracheale]|uniref:Large ribosomal subunit protein uL15 n=1 Tax=Ornithobacterium rhinotracheale (strain ATCC 51463 / DSM 15997 / CCUG 23171 / CIP 104009 / LMG 9086) TaxID=867902 RepID=I3ZY78_ORNRL|nr:50S ribosomal protein L15 [Ornithobacterium rhinotracheale]AFL96662.1 LSU ribosomal protein L15P [Ornithobacterium rhinotracheale DSM 15997]AIP99541.1 50S ribosomal protein L15 [Ornithobacterium rhinotracheale ORT-UMN 88]KGB66548.1 50S ribosomal protein L15 [Ornithobacterium rhinotracheale H06-030791]MBN3662554.1 50S ribosomal protein L15 [Ornithobacterium rhinotracheale]MCK0194011.1 50S ribosomal protein L15 [Ornithobacterium rhinotracheale]